MSRRCLFNSVTAGLIIWALIAAWYFDNGPLLILGSMAGLIWVWAAVGPGDYDRTPTYRYDRDDERLPR